MAVVNQAPGIGARIAEARIAAGLTQEALAAAVGHKGRTIQSWERNERTPRLPALRLVAERTGRPVAWFYASEPEEAAAC